MTKTKFFLGSSPITILFQSLYLFNILIIAAPKTSYPLEEFNLPTKEIILLFIEINFGCTTEIY